MRNGSRKFLYERKNIGDSKEIVDLYNLSGDYLITIYNFIHDETLTVDDDFVEDYDLDDLTKDYVFSGKIPSLYDLYSKDQRVIKDNCFEIISNKNLKKFYGLISPKITINKNYINFSEKNISDNDKVYLKNNLQEAKLFIKNIDYRNNTLIKISNSIFEKQIDFFNKGVEEIKPMNLKEIALSIDVHESTVSRLTNGKYMETPYGIFELKYFFSSSLSNNLGDDLSSKSIKEKIKKIINAENKNKPFSDDKIAYILQNQGINIARRTVAKYRESLNLESSSKRKTK